MKVNAYIVNYIYKQIHIEKNSKNCVHLCNKYFLTNFHQYFHTEGPFRHDGTYVINITRYQYTMYMYITCLATTVLDPSHHR